MERAGDARAPERLLRAELAAQRHQPGHLALGDLDLLAPVRGEREVGHAVVIGCQLAHGGLGHLSSLGLCSGILADARR